MVWAVFEASWRLDIVPRARPVGWVPPTRRSSSLFLALRAGRQRDLQELELGGIRRFGSVPRGALEFFCRASEDFGRVRARLGLSERSLRCV